MAVDERKRHEMYLSLERTIGREAADTLMELVPPVGWADVATKHDLAHYAEVHEEQLQRLKAEILGQMHHGFRNQAFAFIMLMSVINGVMLGLAKVS